MKPTPISIRQAAGVVLLLCVAGILPAAGQWHSMSSSSVAEEKPDPALTIGKKLFVERCGRCHDERGDKPLPEGLPLNERTLTREGIVRAVASRLRDKTDDERRAVVAYIESFLKTKPSADLVLSKETIAAFG
ncbi:MAG TPA: cytochrome c [Candidatus Acidoferrales bacterium]|nr:cytochrome c [Candidatus Acidoferrales bacterium]